MSDVVIEFLNATFGVTVAVVVVILCLFVWIIVKVTRYVTKHQCDKEAILREQDSLRLELKDQVARNNLIIDDVRKDLSMIKGSLEIIKSNATPLMQSHSPVSLTPAGVEVMKELDATTIISRNWDSRIEPAIRQEVERQGGLNAYQLQTFAIETSAVEPDRFYTKQDITAIQGFAYEKGMPDQLYLRAMGLLIRDKYFEVHQIELDEVDRTDPSIMHQ